VTKFPQQLFPHPKGNLNGSATEEIANLNQVTFSVSDK
jgi:hypothetical protein